MSPYYTCTPCCTPPKRMRENYTHVRMQMFVYSAQVKLSKFAQTHVNHRRMRKEKNARFALITKSPLGSLQVAVIQATFERVHLIMSPNIRSPTRPLKVIKTAYRPGLQCVSRDQGSRGHMNDPWHDRHVHLAAWLYVIYTCPYMVICCTDSLTHARTHSRHLEGYKYCRIYSSHEVPHEILM